MDYVIKDQPDASASALSSESKEIINLSEKSQAIISFLAALIETEQYLAKQYSFLQKNHPAFNTLAEKAKNNVEFLNKIRNAITFRERNIPGIAGEIKLDSIIDILSDKYGRESFCRDPAETYHYFTLSLQYRDPSTGERAPDLYSASYRNFGPEPGDDSFIKDKTLMDALAWIGKKMEESRLARLEIYGDPIDLPRPVEKQSFLEKRRERRAFQEKKSKSEKREIPESFYAPLDALELPSYLQPQNLLKEKLGDSLNDIRDVIETARVKGIHVAPAQVSLEVLDSLLPGILEGLPDLNANRALSKLKQIEIKRDGKEIPMTPARIANLIASAKQVHSDYTVLKEIHPHFAELATTALDASNLLSKIKIK